MYNTLKKSEISQIQKHFWIKHLYSDTSAYNIPLMALIIINPWFIIGITF